MPKSTIYHMQKPERESPASICF